MEYQGKFIAFAIRCAELGWHLAAVDVRNLVDLAVNFSEPVEHWLRKCSQAGPLKGRVKLGVYTGSISGLLALEVKSGEEIPELARGGPWRSRCRARLNGREQHYYALPPGTAAPPSRFLPLARVMVYGEDGLAPLPPSLDVPSQEAWSWLAPPWENPPSEAPSALLTFLQQPETAVLTKHTLDIPSWDEIYRLITPHEPLLKALLAPCPAPADYYRTLLAQAREAGLQDEKFFLGLLWYAPLGDARHNPRRFAWLKRLVSTAGAGLASSPQPSATGGEATEEAPKGGLPSPSRYEDILADLRLLRQKAVELEAVLLDWESRSDEAGPRQGQIFSEVTALSPAEPVSAGTDECQRVEKFLRVFQENLDRKKPQTDPFWNGWNGRPQEDDQENLRFHFTELASKAPSPLDDEAVEMMIQACLEENPDLAEDPVKFQMFQYCFKNYVSIDPDLSDLSLRERLERAGQMAREFLDCQVRGLKN
ncbi:MAG: hypothetical protein ACUVXF_02625 [Desulfobaccales bacterium]